jgi:hypothetical protein
MARRSSNAYDYALGRRESETVHADTFEAEFPVITGRAVEILSGGESPDRIALIDGVETGVELTAIHAGSADDIVDEMFRLVGQKHESYERRGIFAGRPIIRLGHLSWPAKEVEGPALYDVQKELERRVVPEDFEGFGFSEIWLMDDGPKYKSRRDPRAPADFFCFAPADDIGFWGQERKRCPYWGLIRDFLM